MVNAIVQNGIRLCAPLLLSIAVCPAVAGEMRSMTLQDIVLIRELLEPQMSPDGQWVAFVVKQARIPTNDYESSLQIVATTATTDPRVLRKASSFSNVRWSTASDALYYISDNDGPRQIKRLKTREAAVEDLVLRHNADITRFEVSPDGQKIAFVSHELPTASDRRNFESNGIVYDDTIHSATTLITDAWQPEGSVWRLWIHDLRAQTTESLWQNSMAIDKLVWSPDSSAIAVVYAAPAHPSQGGSAFNMDIGVISLTTRVFKVIAVTPKYETNPAWSPDGGSIAYVVGGVPSFIRKVQVGGGQPTDLVSEFPVSSDAQLEWSRDGRRVFIGNNGFSTVGLFAVPEGGGEVLKVVNAADHVSAFSFSKDQRRAACIRQSPMAPPEIAVTDLSSGELMTLTSLHPEIRDIALGEITRMTWKNKYGHETSGYLVKPLRFQKGQRYPLLVILYGFTGKFISQAEWITSYPVEVFAAHGFVVLLVNQPRAEEATAIKGYKWEQLVEAYGPMASIESAVDTLAANGLVDPTRQGIMGWSYGGFLTQFVVTHSDLFQAASAGECGLWDPGNYWAAGSRVFREAAERITGGPPYGPSLANWEEFSPSMNAHRVRAPVLLEHASKKVHPLEFYTAMKRQGKSVEMVIYPGEAHIFSQPKHRLASMARNLDWFSFWLKGEEDSDPAKAEQYKRWRELRKSQQADRQKSDHSSN